jgi:hypothetical protein
MALTKEAEALTSLARVLSAVIPFDLALSLLIARTAFLGMSRRKQA